VWLCEQDADRAEYSVIKQWKASNGLTQKPLHFCIATSLSGVASVQFSRGRNVSFMERLEGTVMSETRRRILTLFYIRNYPMTPQAVAQTLRLPAPSVRVELRRMLDEGSVKQETRGLYALAEQDDRDYQLPTLDAS
jgi:hypothetical protein